MSNRMEWSRQVALLNESLKKFQVDPGKEQFDAAISKMRAYAEAVQTGSVDVPVRFTAGA